MDAHAQPAGPGLEDLMRFPPNLLKRVFKQGNRFMVAMFRLGFGPFISNPYSGYVMVIATTGRKTGLRRRTPVNFARGIDEVYCISGFGRTSDWYRNLLADPNCHVWVGGEGWQGRAEVLADPAEWLPIYREVIARSGFAESAFTKRPYSSISDEEMKRLGDGSVVRIRLGEKLSGPNAPGDLRWLWGVLAGVFLIRMLRRRRRRHA
jgi:deazaflavin-dependent oxidoreductase (nitroreductase family)